VCFSIAIDSQLRQGEGVGNDKTPLALYSAHRRALTSYASGIVGDSSSAEDVVQDAWLRFGSAMGRRPLEEPVGYLYRIVRNLAVDARRRLLRDKVLARQAMELAGGMADAKTPEVDAAAREDLRRLIRAMDELPERTRIAVEMRRLDGCKLREIAERLGVSVPVAHQIVAEGIAHCHRRLRLGR
jgi:RNA polymerase sigma factor (sigma-70 family)